LTFNIPLSAPPTVKFAGDTGCSGNFEQPTAEKGLLCVYPLGPVSNASFLGELATPSGVWLAYGPTAAEHISGIGAYAVTAP
jgi:hypothetical protein